jgi:mono/diheme cytochrome c family protein/DNA-binding beta-propeller fold protein YncE
MPRSRSCFCLLCATLAAALALALATLAPPLATGAPPAKPAALAGKPAAGKPVSFIHDVAPLLKESCFGCHGAKNPKGKLDMTRYAALRRGGTKDDPVAEGKPEDSYLIDVLTATDKKRMPPLDSGDALPKEKIDLIARWIKEGAKLDAGLKPEADLLRELRLRWTPPPPLAAYPFPVTVTSLAFTPDGKNLVVSGHHELNVFDAATGKLEKRVRTRARRAMAMVFLPDGKLAVAGGRPGEEGDVRVYNLSGGKPRVEGGVSYLDGVGDPGVMVKQLLDAEDEVQCLALSADGKKLASGGNDRLVHVWDLSAGLDKVKELPAIENHADWVFGIAFSPDGKHLYTCSSDKTAKVWDLAAKESLLTFPDHQNKVFGVAAKADGKAGYSVGEDNQLRMWATTGNRAGKQVRNTGGHGKAVLKLVNVPKKKELLTCSADGTIKVWNAENLGNTRTLAGFTDYVFCVAASPDGTLAAGGAYNGEVRVYKLADGKLLAAFNASPGLKVQAKK